MGIGRALGFVSDTIVLALVIWRVSGPADCAARKPQTTRRKTEAETGRRDFIATSRKYAEKPRGISDRNYTGCTFLKSAVSHLILTLIAASLLTTPPRRTPAG